MDRTPHRLRDESGFAMVGLMLVMLLLLSFGAFSTLNSSLSQRATSHYDTANRAFFAAESGVMHSLSTINAAGVIDFKKDVADRWATVYGSSTKTLPSDPAASYTVTVAADPAAPSTNGTVTVTGQGPLQARRTLQVRLGKGGFDGSPGAIHIAADENVSTAFRGNAFDVNGNNHNRFGLPVAGIVKPGITTRNDPVKQDVVDSLSNQQKDNVRGLGFSSSPLTPSVLPAGGPGVDDLDQFVADLLSRPGVVSTDTKKFNGGDVFGTTLAPQITYMTNSDVQLNGSAVGAGILIVDGSITINGNLDFTGLIIVRGNTMINSQADPDNETVVLGNATILGSLWTGSLEITVGGSAIARYCQECLQLVDNVGGSPGAIPRPMTVVSWGEVL